MTAWMISIPAEMRRPSRLPSVAAAATPDAQQQQPTQEQQQQQAAVMAAAAERRARGETERCRRLHAHAMHVHKTCRANAEKQTQRLQQLDATVAARLQQTAERRHQRLQLRRKQQQHRRSMHARDKAARTVQGWWRWWRLKRAMKVHLTQPPLLNETTFASLQTRLLSKALAAGLATLLSSALRPSLSLPQGNSAASVTRVFLAAYPLALFPGEVLDEAAQSPDEHTLVKQAQQLLAEFERWLYLVLASRRPLPDAHEALAARWRAFDAGFTAWKARDGAALVAGMAATHRELDRLRTSTAHPPGTRAEWWPHIDGQQRELRRRLQQLSQHVLATVLESESHACMTALIARGQRLDALDRAQLAHAIAADDAFRLPDPLRKKTTTTDDEPGPTKHRGANQDKDDGGDNRDDDDDGDLEFWRALRSDLQSARPPRGRVHRVFTRLLEALQATTLPRHTKLRAQMAALCDADLLAQQVEYGAFDGAAFQAQLVAVLLGVCAPQRDEQVRALATLTDPVAFLQRAFTVLRGLHVDLANMHISAVRGLLQQPDQSAVEARCWRECVAAGDITLPDTTAWLLRARDVLGLPADVSRSCSVPLVHAGLRLLVAGEVALSTDAGPETWRADARVVARLGVRLQDLVLAIGACMLLVSAGVWPSLQAGAPLVDVFVAVCAAAPTFADAVPKLLDLALDFARFPASTSKPKTASVSAAAAAMSPDPVDEQAMKARLLGLGGPQHPLRSLLTRRALDALFQPTYGGDRQHACLDVAHRHFAQLHAEILALAMAHDHMHATLYGSLLLLRGC